MKKYSSEIKLFIWANVEGTTTKELTEIVNQKFGTDFTEASMKSYKANHKLKSGTKGGNKKGDSKLFPEKIREFIRTNAKGKYNSELAELVNSTFSTNYTINQIDCYKSNNKILSGLTGHFEPGHIPYSKGKKMSPEQYEMCKATMFKKGQIPVNHRPVGSERITVDGYTEIKIKEPNKWGLKHRILWEEHNGSIPKGFNIVFLDNNKRNITLENLALVSDAEMGVINRSKLKSENSEITTAGIAIARLKITTNKLKRQLKNG